MRGRSLMVIGNCLSIHRLRPTLLTGVFISRSASRLARVKLPSMTAASLAFPPINILSVPYSLNLNQLGLEESLIDNSIIADADSVGVFGARDFCEPWGNGSS